MSFEHNIRSFWKISKDSNLLGSLLEKFIRTQARALIWHWRLFHFFAAEIHIFFINLRERARMIRTLSLSLSDSLFIFARSFFFLNCFQFDDRMRKKKENLWAFMRNFLSFSFKSHILLLLLVSTETHIFFSIILLRMNPFLFKLHTFIKKIKWKTCYKIYLSMFKNVWFLHLRAPLNFWLFYILAIFF